ncbi:hypothetical protein ABT063_41680 [Streptomyces sp. NPDC002838]|uniref:hypothetical protein n=1 Tax=Streptomyces sp. NPDC002838 TaxID=3154436 RepID=UPI00331D24ED
MRMPTNPAVRPTIPVTKDREIQDRAEDGSDGRDHPPGAVAVDGAADRWHRAGADERSGQVGGGDLGAADAEEAAGVSGLR